MIKILNLAVTYKYCQPKTLFPISIEVTDNNCSITKIKRTKYFKGLYIANLRQLKYYVEEVEIPKYVQTEIHKWLCVNLRAVPYYLYARLSAKEKRMFGRKIWDIDVSKIKYKVWHTKEYRKLYWQKNKHKYNRTPKSKKS